MLSEAARHDAQGSVRKRTLQFQSVGARCALIQISISSGVVSMTGIALGWIGATSAFGSVVRNAKRSFVVSPSLTLRTDVQRVQTPAKTRAVSPRRARTKPADEIRPAMPRFRKSS